MKLWILYRANETSDNKIFIQFPYGVKYVRYQCTNQLMLKEEKHQSNFKQFSKETRKDGKAKKSGKLTLNKTNHFLIYS